MEKFRLLKADEIECKVKKVTEKGAVLLLYKTARTDMDLLDETVGAENWTDRYEEIKGNLYCEIGIWNAERKEWVWKQDCGIESREDGEGNEKKGEASDAFKRAGFRWGIGRELYTAPFIWIPADRMKIDGTGGKFKTFDTFSVASIGYDENSRIVSLTINNDKQKCQAFSIGKQEGKKTEPPKQTPTTEIPKLTCDVCHSVIIGYKGRGGKEVTPEEHIAATKKNFGKVLCLDCARKAAKDKGAAGL